VKHLLEDLKTFNPELEVRVELIGSGSHEGEEPEFVDGVRYALDGDVGPVQWQSLDRSADVVVVLRAMSNEQGD
jgi:hypothetical protein